MLKQEDARKSTTHIMTVKPKFEIEKKQKTNLPDYNGMGSLGHGFFNLRSHSGNDRLGFWEPHRDWFLRISATSFMFNWFWLLLLPEWKLRLKVGEESEQVDGFLRGILFVYDFSVLGHCCGRQGRFVIVGLGFETAEKLELCLLVIYSFLTSCSRRTSISFKLN